MSSPTIANQGTDLIQQSLTLALYQLSLFAQSPNLREQMRLAFGGIGGSARAEAIIGDLLAGQTPAIEIVPDLGGARGAYSNELDRIYLSESWVTANADNPQAIAEVLLEELGHSIDRRLNTSDSAGDEGELFAALVQGRTLSDQELARIQAEDDRQTLVINGQTQTVELATYGSINVDGNLADWTAAERLDTAPGSSQAGYEVYGKYAASTYVFGLKSAVAVGANSTIWIDADRNAATGHQIFGFAGGAEYAINVDSTGAARLYNVATNFSGDFNSIPVVNAKILDSQTVGNNWEVAVAGTDLGPTAPAAINVLADVNNTVFIPNDYNRFKYTVSQTAPGTKTNYGNINLDGSLADWTRADRLDYLPGSVVAGHELYGRNTADGYVFAIKAPTAIGNNSTIWLDTDKNRATGHQIFGFAGGAEYNINIDSNGDAYLYTGGAGEKIVQGSKLDARRSSDGTILEVAVSKDLIPAGNGLNLLADVNDTTFLPSDYNNSRPYSVPGATVVRTDASKKVAIVYSETSANRYFDKTAYSQLFMSAQEEAIMAGIPFDVLSTDDLKDMNKVVQYDTLVFPSFQHVAQSDLPVLQENLERAVFQYGISLVTAGNFMTNNENGDPLADAYSRMRTLLNLQPEAFGSSTISLNTVANPILQGYAAGETVRSYNPMGWNAFNSVDPTKTTVLANQTVNNGTYNAVVATTTGGNNVHFASESFLGDTQLLQQALQWTTYDGQPSVKLSLTRNNSLFTARNDMDKSQDSLDVNPAGDAPGVYDRMLPIVEQWKRDYNFVGSYYINIGNNRDINKYTDWAVSKPYYDRLLAMGNEIGTHSYTHFEEYQGYNPTNNTNAANQTQLEFEFNQSQLEIEQRLGINVTGAALPGAPETFDTAQKILPYFDYISGGYSGVGSGYPGAFGYMRPGQSQVYLAPNLYFDFTLVGFGIPVFDPVTGTLVPKKLTAAEAEVEWVRQLNEVTNKADKPIVMMPWHDYGPTNWDNNGYNTQMFTALIQAAYNSGAEFTTLDDVSKRIKTFEQSQLTINNTAPNTITATVAPATGNTLGKFSLDLNPGASIRSVTGWYAYDDDSVFLPATGGTYTINLGATPDDVSHIRALAQRAELLSVTGNGSNLGFSFRGEGKITADMKAITSNQRYRVTGANSFTVNGDKVELTFNANTTHTASIEIVNNSAPTVANPIAPIVENNNSPATRTIDLTNVFVDLDGDVITRSLVSNSNTGLLNASLTGNTLTLKYNPYEFGTTTLTLRGTSGGQSVNTSFNVTVNPTSPLLNGSNNSETINDGNNGTIVKGLLGNDRLNGNGGNDTLIGGGGNDSLFGGAGNDVLLGANPASATPGRGSYDVLQGDGGNDRFILGDVNAVYYNDGNNSSTGRSDYAAIFTFGTGDVIQLKGQASHYVLAVGTAPNNGSQQGTLIQSTLFGQPELIGFVAGVTNLNLTSSAFAYV
jgi:serralysin